ncbi:uncharacterized protein LOC125197191 [Salvia hispanica]|uniref:uncharacterized protein LOC125197191 n=1 Tax=Salvia hispanica TaxID=49212 RepID=UPI0020096E34|nr:uncharacterized protein LOC125197191 [Salvia hispanica]XP_047951860.1 uncharacterized protein LOC125197191 [Salvia hispanica]XP_047951861.1 uncharacterized protein LOC125197191 [Salvia hispanica]
MLSHQPFSGRGIHHKQHPVFVLAKTKENNGKCLEFIEFYKRTHTLKGKDSEEGVLCSQRAIETMEKVSAKADELRVQAMREQVTIEVREDLEKKYEASREDLEKKHEALVTEIERQNEEMHSDFD